MTTEPYRSRIVGHGEADPATLAPNPRNWRAHPEPQRAVLAGVLVEVGWVQDVIVNQRTGYLVDGHLRVEEAIRAGQASVPVVYVDLDEAEEALVLATLDPSAAMATANAERLDALLRDVHSGDSAISRMLADVAARANILPESPYPDLPEGDRGNIRQMTFTVTAEQQSVIEAALDAARDAGPYADTGNENGNGNALARVCEAYV